jgi:hypothetical protein
MFPKRFPDPQAGAQQEKESAEVDKARRRSGKWRAIRNVLAHNGMQASPQQVVATLAVLGMDVTEALVRQVKLEMLKEAARAERQRARVVKVERPRVQRPPKKPPRRSP